jgi:hypothetical protein
LSAVCGVFLPSFLPSPYSPAKLILCPPPLRSSAPLVRSALCLSAMYSLPRGFSQCRSSHCYNGKATSHGCESLPPITLMSDGCLPNSREKLAVAHLLSLNALVPTLGQIHTHSSWCMSRYSRYFKVRVTTHSLSGYAARAHVACAGVPCPCYSPATTTANGPLHPQPYIYIYKSSMVCCVCLRRNIYIHPSTQPSLSSLLKHFSPFHLSLDCVLIRCRVHHHL